MYRTKAYLFDVDEKGDLIDILVKYVREKA